MNCSNLPDRQKNWVRSVKPEYGVALLRKEDEPEELSTMLVFSAAVTHVSQFCESRITMEEHVCSVQKKINVARKINSTVETSDLYSV
jgi:hypothetical protein